MAEGDATAGGGARTWYRPMFGRDPGQSHRAATPLELFFDLCFVVAVALAAGRLHHALAEGHPETALPGYAMVFFAIWWAWMNFTWFASAYDTDDVPYRLATMVQIAGALILAAGVPRAFDNRDFGLVVVGYIVMRAAMIGQWLRAARSDPSHRPAALRYAAGIAACQVGWILRLALPVSLGTVSFIALALAEVLVPIWAERPGMSTWHPGHIAERYGLFTLIVLGESILATTMGIQAAFDGGAGKPALLLAAGSALLIVFAMWWIYFDQPAGSLPSAANSFVWGYSHLLIFASAAAVGAGLQVGVDAITGVAHTSGAVIGLSLAVPVALYLLGVWAIDVRARPPGLFHTVASPIAAALALATVATPWPLPLLALLLTGRVGLALLLARQAQTEVAGMHAPVGQAH